MELKNRRDERAKELVAYRLRLQELGWVRLNAWISPELRKHLASQRLKGDCNGRLLERMILGTAARRPWKARY